MEKEKATTIKPDLRNEVLDLLLESLVNANMSEAVFNPELILKLTRKPLIKAIKLLNKTHPRIIMGGEELANGFITQ